MDICEIEKYLKLVFGISVVLQRSLIFWREWICLRKFVISNVLQRSLIFWREKICFTNVLIVSGNGIVSRLTACMMCTEASLDPMCTISTVSYGNGWVNSSWQTRATISPIHVYARNTFFVLFVYLERTFKWQSCQRFSLILSLTEFRNLPLWMICWILYVNCSRYMEDLIVWFWKYSQHGVHIEVSRDYLSVSLTNI